jgi:Ca2+/Na+ antiporter
MNNFNRLWKKHRDLVKNKNFLNSQNYILSDMWRYSFYKWYVSQSILGSVLFLIVPFVIAFGFHFFPFVTWVLVQVLILFFCIFVYFYIKLNKATDNKLKIFLFKKYKSDEKLDYYIFRKKIWWNTQKYFFKSKKIIYEK